MLQGVEVARDHEHWLDLILTLSSTEDRTNGQIDMSEDEEATGALKTMESSIKGLT